MKSQHHCRCKQYDTADENISSGDENLYSKEEYGCHKIPNPIHTYNTNRPMISPHLVGLGTKVRKEVSPIQRHEDMYLMNSSASLFDSHASHMQNSHMEHDINDPKSTGKFRNLFTREANFATEKKYINQNCESEVEEVPDLTLEESSEQVVHHDRNNSQRSDEIIQNDEGIEMERIMKMNFYQFKSKDHNGIVGMCQNIKNGNKSPNSSSMLNLNTSRSNA